MILWTIQNAIVYEKMNQTGVLRADKEYIVDDFFLDSYLWMSGQVKKRISNPPNGVTLPVWAWYQWEGKRKRPDMRVHGRNWGEKGAPIVLLTIDVPENQVLLSDFDSWHYVLNNLEIADPDDEEAESSKEKKQHSWEKIFCCPTDSEEYSQSSV